jgi:endonuclease/exonuclease/phosphatase family metal-dependent hydrolase
LENPQKTMLSLLLSTLLTFVEFNCENLFDTKHDSLKQDTEYLPTATRRWTEKRYWHKQNSIAKTILSTIDDGVPDLVALCEIENEQTMIDLTRRSLLRNAGYNYVVTDSPDQRGIDVALLYQPLRFALISSHSLRVPVVENMRPTRDILYACGRLSSGDTLHVYVVHAPSRHGGEQYSRPFRMATAERLCQSLDSLFDISSQACVLIAGDFNDYADSPALQVIGKHGVSSITRGVQGQNGVYGTYRYKGEWDSLDHIFGSKSICEKIDTTYIHAPRFLLEEDNEYGGYRPRRTYNGMRYQRGYSDHLPLVVRIRKNHLSE